MKKLLSLCIVSACLVPGACWAATPEPPRSFDDVLEAVSSPAAGETQASAGSSSLILPPPPVPLTVMKQWVRTPDGLREIEVVVPRLPAPAPTVTRRTFTSPLKSSLRKKIDALKAKLAVEKRLPKPEQPPAVPEDSPLPSPNEDIKKPKPLEEAR